ncbi:glycosyltransferase [Mycobacterium marinum]|uniref:glycosyltransferase n=1 Tax=Mycobacterium marinum TaxID=1781 RepID=UPI003563C293
MNSVGVPTPQGRLRVLVVGPAPAAATSRGGMATVIALMAAHPDPHIHITAVPTFIDGPLWPRLMLGVRGMLRATWLVLRRRTDVLHVHLAHGGSVIRKALPLLAARLTGTPAIVHAHSYDFGGWFDQLPPGRRCAGCWPPITGWCWGSAMSRSTPAGCGCPPTGSACYPTRFEFRTPR